MDRIFQWGVLGVSLVFILCLNFDKKKGFQFIAPSKSVKHFTLGYQDSVSDTLWIRIIQDFDYCKENKQDRSFDQNSSITYSGFSCHQGWVFRMLDLITELTPRNRLPYTVGAMVLSVLVNDKEGARRIFEKGIQQYPFDWLLNYRAAYHYMIEIGDEKRAADLLNTAAEHGAPKWVYSLASRLYQKEGRRALSIMALKNYLKNFEEGTAYHEKVKARLEKVLQKTEVSP